MSIEFFKKLPADQLLYSAISFVFILLIRTVFIRIIKNTKTMRIENKRRWTVNANSLFSVLLFITLVFIWVNQIQTFTLSITAIAVAVVLATKDLIQCFTGAIYKAFINSFHIGDRIEIAGVRGDVIDRNVFSTTILEMGPGKTTNQYTGRSIQIPNSIFLHENCYNESFLKDYVLHTFTIAIGVNEDWERAKDIILKYAKEECAEHQEIATSHISRIQSRAHLETPHLKPRVHINIVDHEQIDFIVRIVAPSNIKGKIEQKIIINYLKEFKKTTFV